MIGLAGSHRTGKSTLAQKFAAKASIPFVETNAKGTFERLQLCPKVDYNFRTRLMIQREILADADILYRKGGVKFITDRTPIDMMAYTIADVLRDNICPQDAESLGRYMEECFKVTNQHFTTIIVIQPGIALVESEGKAPANPAYMEHINLLCQGLVISDRLEAAQFVIPRSLTDLQARMNSVEFALTRTNQMHTSFMESIKQAGHSFH